MGVEACTPVRVLERAHLGSVSRDGKEQVRCPANATGIQLQVALRFTSRGRGPEVTGKVRTGRAHPASACALYELL